MANTSSLTVLILIFGLSVLINLGSTDTSKQNNWEKRANGFQAEDELDDKANDDVEVQKTTKVC